MFFILEGKHIVSLKIGQNMQATVVYEMISLYFLLAMWLNSMIKAIYRSKAYAGYEIRSVNQVLSVFIPLCYSSASRAETF